MSGTRAGSSPIRLEFRSTRSAGSFAAELLADLRAPYTQRFCCQTRSISIESPASRIARARGGLVFAA
jgi:hypothetical protein